jgi:AsmA-like C-terminal region
VIGAAIGAPTVARRDAPWSPEPFVAGPLADVEGRLDFAVANATLASGLTGRQLRGTVRFAPAAIMLDKLEGVLAEGRLIAQADVRAAATGVATRMQVSLVNADLAALLPRTAAGRASGRVTLGFDASGAGLSPAALIGALQGQGTASVEHLVLTGLDPSAIDAATRAAERGVSLDGIRIGDIVRTALDDGRLNIPDAGGTLAIAGGRLTLAPLVTPAQGADVAISGSYDLSADVLDARFDLTGAPRQNGPSGQRPALSVALKGPLEAPRRSEDVTALVNWLTLRSVEQEAKRVEAAERAASRIKAQEEAALRRAQEAAKAARVQEEAAKAARVQEEAAKAARTQEEAAAAARADQTAGIPVGPRSEKPSEKASDKAPDLPPTVDITTPPVTVPASRPRQAPAAADRGSSTRPAAPPLVITPPSVR